MAESKVEEINVVVLGTGAVGKSSITVQFVKSFFKEGYDPTIEDAYDKKTEVDGKLVLLHIIDTAGQEQYQAMRDVYMQQGHVFILVYSITDPNSYEELRSFYDHLARVQDSEDVPLIVVGNKCDLEEERGVSTQLGKELSQSFGNLADFIEVSAKTRKNIDELFYECVRKWRNLKAGILPAPKEETPKTTVAGASTGATVKGQKKFSLFTSISGKGEQQTDLDRFYGK